MGSGPQRDRRRSSRGTQSSADDVLALPAPPRRTPDRSGRAHRRSPRRSGRPARRRSSARARRRRSRAGSRTTRRSGRRRSRRPAGRSRRCRCRNSDSPASGISRSTRYVTTTGSTQSTVRNAVCPSASTVNSTADDSESASATDQSYGVAGSPRVADHEDRRGAVGGPEDQRIDRDRACRCSRCSPAGTRRTTPIRPPTRRPVRAAVGLVGTVRVVGTVDEQVGLLLVVVGAVGFDARRDCRRAPAGACRPGRSTRCTAPRRGTATHPCCTAPPRRPVAVRRASAPGRGRRWCKLPAAAMSATSDCVRPRSSARARCSTQSSSASQAAAKFSNARVEAGTLLPIEFGEVVGGLDATVEHERPDPVGEQFGVRRAEPRAVGEPDVARAGRHRAPPGSGRDRGRRCWCPTNGARSSASAGQSSARPSASSSSAAHPVVVALVEQRDVVVDLDVAVDGRARTDAARVEADEVEALRRSRRERASAADEHEVDPRSARAARIEHERADPLVGIGGGHAGEGDVDRRRRPARRGRAALRASRTRGRRRCRRSRRRTHPSRACPCRSGVGRSVSGRVGARSGRAGRVGRCRSSVWFASTDDTPDDVEHAASPIDSTNTGASTATLETRLTIGRYCPIPSATAAATLAMSQRSTPRSVRSSQRGIETVRRGRRRCRWP